MKCRFCGTNLPDDARFCSGCGREVERENVSAKEKNNNETEDAYYREIDDKEYEEIKKKKKEEERQREEAAKEEAERKLLEEKYAREEAERKRREEQRIMEESRRRYEEEQRRWKEFVKKQEESEAKKLYRGYDAGSGTAASESTKKRQEVKPQKKKKSSMPFLLYLFIVLAGGFALYKCGFPEVLIDSIHKSSSISDSKKNTSSKGGKDKKDVDKKTTDNTTSDKAGEKKEAEHMLKDTENLHMSVENCLSTDAYNTVISEDGSFSFGYPKYLFNHSEMNALGNSYSLTYKEGSEEKKAELAVYTEENEGNALENAKQLYDRFSSQVNKIYFKMQPTRTDSEGMARTLIGASVDSSETTGVYIIAANDGEKNYILKFTYPDPDMKDDYNAIDYVVDCVYRYCSFSGGTYRPRTYQQFLKDDMGKKK